MHGRQAGAHRVALLRAECSAKSQGAALCLCGTMHNRGHTAAGSPHLDSARCRPHGVVYTVIQRALKGSQMVVWSAVPPNVGCSGRGSPGAHTCAAQQPAAARTIGLVLPAVSSISKHATLPDSHAAHCPILARVDGAHSPQAATTADTARPSCCWAPAVMMGPPVDHERPWSHDSMHPVDFQTVPSARSQRFCQAQSISHRAGRKRVGAPPWCSESAGALQPWLSCRGDTARGIACRAAPPWGHLGMEEPQHVVL